MKRNKQPNTCVEQFSVAVCPITTLRAGNIAGGSSFAGGCALHSARETMRKGDVLGTGVVLMTLGVTGAGTPIFEPFPFTFIVIEEFAIKNIIPGIAAMLGNRF